MVDSVFVARFFRVLSLTGFSFLDVSIWEVGRTSFIGGFTESGTTFGDSSSSSGGGGGDGIGIFGELEDGEGVGEGGEGGEGGKGIKFGEGCIETRWEEVVWSGGGGGIGTEMCGFTESTRLFCDSFSSGGFSIGIIGEGGGESGWTFEEGNEVGIEGLSGRVIVDDTGGKGARFLTFGFWLLTFGFWFDVSLSDVFFEVFLSISVRTCFISNADLSSLSNVY